MWRGSRHDAAIRRYLLDPEAQKDNAHIFRCGGHYKWRVMWLKRINFPTDHERVEITCK